MRILFECGGSLGESGGVSVALYDYALYNEELLGNESILIAPRRAKGFNIETIQRYRNRFPIIYGNSLPDIDRAASELKADLFYCLKYGIDDGVVATVVKSCIHAVFTEAEIHGDVYAYVSEWLSKTMSDGKLPFVPHIVHPPKTEDDFRDFFAIPQDAIVFGRYGRSDTFDIPFVQEAVISVAKKRKDIFFLFMNTAPFYNREESQDLSNIIHVPGTADVVTKSAFINTCDAMLHARRRGETFGLAVGEFSAHNKPIITFGGSPERAHMDILRGKGIYYNDIEELLYILTHFRPDRTVDWDCYSRKFSPENVMKKFAEVFF